jgi:hydrogenase assembly chaperone HypC/HupF
MCLTIPKQIISLKSNEVKLRNGAAIETASTIISVKKGDWVLTQNGVIIKKIKQKEAEEILDIINQYQS